MRQSAVVQRYRAELRNELLTSLTKNELERGYKRRVVLKPRDEGKALTALAEKIKREGPCPVSDRLQAKLRARHEA